MIAKKEKCGKTQLHGMIKHVEKQINDALYVIARFSNSASVHASLKVDKAESSILRDRPYLQGLKERHRDLQTIEEAYDKKDETLAAYEMQAESMRAEEHNLQPQF